jgi:hypothetical protein
MDADVPVGELSAAQPLQARHVHTWTAEVNDAMRTVNECLGFPSCRDQVRNSKHASDVAPGFLGATPAGLSR